MSRNEKDGLPSYSESTGLSTPRNHTGRGTQILDQLTLVRAQHIRSVIETSIIPLVEQQASYGIAQTTIAMVPSDVNLPPEEEKSEFSFDSNTKKVEVIGFSSDEEPKVIRLEGQLNRTEFWRTQAIIAELESRLREALNESTLLRSPTRDRFGVMEVVTPAPQKQQRRTLFGRVVDVISQESGGGPESRPVDAVSEVPMAGMGMVLVRARLEEICLRTVNDFGLYDTMSKQCVIIRVDARC